MARQAVYIVCARDEDVYAEQLAAPLREAGYEVAHLGTVAVGESEIGEAEKALMAGVPIILCATVRAIGSGLPHRIIHAARSSEYGPVFVVQMERDAYVDQLRLDGKVARYCDNPAKAVKDLLDALAKHFPSTPPKIELEFQAQPSSGGQFLDQLTNLDTFDPDAVSKFRSKLREEAAAKYPSALTAREFLSRAGLWVDGRLTRTGALLFAEDPTAVCATAMVKCTRYDGIDRAAERKPPPRTFEGTVWAQISDALNFVKRLVISGEAPVPGQAQAGTLYDYPMIAVREIIANALVHRDYEAKESCVHVRLFSDRLEVSSPGAWTGRHINSDVQYNFAELKGQPVKRNYRLAHILYLIKLVEGDGSGIPSALKDCEDYQSPIPAMIQDNHFVTVVLNQRKHQRADIVGGVVGGLSGRIVDIETKKPFPYLDSLVQNASYNLEKVSEFRRGMRDDVTASIPAQLTSAEFLQRAGFVRDGKLTHAGLLLFGDNPAAVMPSAVVQCSRFHGVTIISPLESLEIQGTVPEMIVRARDFVADLARVHKAVSNDGDYSTVAYRYPMIAVRELIANAIVHRDYEIQDSCVQILEYSDRLEIISPGGWNASLPVMTETQIKLGQLQQQSQRRNFRLARALTWLRLVEGVGAGIPRALADCHATGAPEPTVTLSDQLVTVTLYPSAERDDIDDNLP